MVTEPESAERIGVYHECELRWAKRLCLASPVLVLLAVPIIDHYLLSFLYLHPADPQWRLFGSFQSKAAVAFSLGIAAIPFIWWAGLKIDMPLRQSRIPWAVLIVIVMLAGAGAGLGIPRLRWFFVEWAKVRTANPSFARNTLFWEQRNFEQTPANDSPGASGAAAKIGLIGSSQTNQGFNLKVLQSDCPTLSFEKNCLAGFGPMQYLYLRDRIDERGFDTIVCQLSEFDFYREDVVPLDRLRWAASIDATAEVASILTPSQRWKDRSALGELTFASGVPLWRLREHFQHTLFGYWWNKSILGVIAPDRDGRPMRLADAPVLEDAIVFLKQNIGHKQMVDANFACFEAFARHLQQQNVNLIVVEGQVHPTARAAYDAGARLQTATRKRLQAMAGDTGFQYISSNEMPPFHAVDFADAYHLNTQGQLKISAFLAEALRDPSLSDNRFPLPPN